MGPPRARPVAGRTCERAESSDRCHATRRSELPSAPTAQNARLCAARRRCGKVNTESGEVRDKLVLRHRACKWRQLVGRWASARAARTLPLRAGQHLAITEKQHRGQAVHLSTDAAAVSAASVSAPGCRTPYFSTSAGLPSVSIFTTLSELPNSWGRRGRRVGGRAVAFAWLRAHACATTPTTLEMSLQGPHQEAQKSTRTGTGDWAAR